MSEEITIKFLVAHYKYKLHGEYTMKKVIANKYIMNNYAVRVK